MTQPTGPIAAANDQASGGNVTLDPKQLLIQALAADVPQMQAGQPGRIQVMDARSVLYDTRRGKPGKNGQPDVPDRVTLAVPPELLLSVRPQGRPPQKRKPPAFYVLMVAVPADVAGEIARQATSRILTPEQAARMKPR